MGLRDTIRSLTPQFLLKLFRSYKKKKVRQDLADQKKTGQIITQVMLVDQLKKMGITAGDTLLVHSSMSKIGYLENGPETFINALIEVIGPEGNLMMPSSPNPSLQIQFIKDNPTFDVNNSPSKLGAITECFRKMPGVKRSWHPTEPVCAFGPDADFLTQGHFGELTPYTANSPFARLYEKNGKILYVGVTLDNAGTNLHTLEDAVDFPYPVYADEIFDVEIIDENGQSHQTKTKVHNPVWSAQRKCDQLLPMFEEHRVMSREILGKSQTLLFNGKGMIELMIEQFKKKGVTMYHPNGK